MFKKITPAESLARLRMYTTNEGADSGHVNDPPVFGFLIGMRHLRLEIPSWDTDRDDLSTDQHWQIEVFPLDSRDAMQRPGIKFDYWNSIHGAANDIDPTPADIVEILANDATMPTDPDEVYADVGEMKPSQAYAVAEFASALQDVLRGAGIDPHDLAEVVNR